MDVVLNEDLIGGEDEAELTTWSVADGDRVAVGDVLGQLETSKVQLDIESPAAGIVRLHVASGDVLEVGTVIASIEEAA